MEQNMNHQIKSVESNGLTINLQEQNSKIGMPDYLSSKYIEEINCILRGEWYTSKSDNAVITGTSLIDYQTCKKLFKLDYFIFYLSFYAFYSNL